MSSSPFDDVLQGLTAVVYEGRLVHIDGWTFAHLFLFFVIGYAVSKSVWSLSSGLLELRIWDNPKGSWGWWREAFFLVLLVTIPFEALEYWLQLSEIDVGGRFWYESAAVKGTDLITNFIGFTAGLAFGGRGFKVDRF